MCVGGIIGAVDYGGDKIQYAEKLIMVVDSPDVLVPPKGFAYRLRKNNFRYEIGYDMVA